MRDKLHILFSLATVQQRTKVILCIRSKLFCKTSIFMLSIVLVPTFYGYLLTPFQF